MGAAWSYASPLALGNTISLEEDVLAGNFAGRTGTVGMSLPRSSHDCMPFHVA